MARPELPSLDVEERLYRMRDSFQTMTLEDGFQALQSAAQAEDGRYLLEVDWWEIYGGICVLKRLPQSHIVQASLVKLQALREEAFRLICSLDPVYKNIDLATAIVIDTDRRPPPPAPQEQNNADDA